MTHKLLALALASSLAVPAFAAEIDKEAGVNLPGAALPAANAVPPAIATPPLTAPTAPAAPSAATTPAAAVPAASAAPKASAAPAAKAASASPLAGLVSKVTGLFSGKKQAAAPAPTGDDEKAKTALGQAQAAAGAASGSGAAFDGSGSAAGPAASVHALADAGKADPEALFAAANPGYDAQKILRKFGVPLRLFAADMTYKHVFVKQKDDEDTTDHLVPPHPSKERQEIADLTRRITALADRKDEQGRAFAAALGRVQAEQDMLALEHGARGKTEKMPANPLGQGEYWDLAAGPNAFFLMQAQADAKSKHVFFDKSPFVLSYLESSRRALAEKGKDMSRVEIREADLRELRKPAVAPSVIRWKNVHGYVRGFESRFVEMAEWLAPGGRMIVQNDPGGQRMGLERLLGPKIEELINAGWTFDYEPLMGGRGLETMTLTRPTGPVGQAALSRSRTRWAEYLDEARSLSAMDRMGFMFFGGR